MTALVLALALLADPDVPAACRKPACACVDATKPDGCPDKAECEKLCADHGGVVELHKKHRRRHHHETPEDAP